MFFNDKIDTNTIKKYNSYRNITYLTFLDPCKIPTAALYKMYEKNQFSTVNLMPTNFHVNLGDVHTWFNSIIFDNSLLYINVHGGQESLKIYDDNGYIIENGVDYLISLLNFPNKSQIQSFNGNGQQHLRISLMICEAASLQKDQNYTFTQLLHSKLLEKAGIFCEVTGRKFISTINPEIPYKAQNINADNPTVLHKLEKSKITYYWEMENNKLVQKWRYDY